MKNKLIFIMSDSEAYLRDETIRIYKKWGFNSSNVKTIQKWDSSLAVNSTTLFGDTSMIHFDLSDKNDLKAFVSLIGKKGEKEKFKKENWYGPGLIITSIHARGAKKIENLVTATGGKVVKKAKPAQMITKLLKRVNLSKNSNDFLRTYAGEDYDMLISVVNGIEDLPKGEQKMLTPAELAVKLPTKPGTVPPWEFTDPLLKGNTAEAIDLFERAMEGSHVLVAMVLARRKLQLLYRLKVLQGAGVWDSKEQAKLLGERNGPGIWIPAKTAKNLSLNTTMYLAKLSLATEADLKGHSSADPHILFKNYIAAACLAIRYNSNMPLSIR